MNKTVPIGVFDSGYGGLTVYREIQKILPQYDYIYLGDNARTPYGTRSFDVVYEYTLEAVKYLFEQGCELIILACNTASAKALRTIQQNYLPNYDSSKRVLGVIRTVAEAVGEGLCAKNVGILATPGTVKSESYVIEINHLYPEINCYQEACAMWVPLVENLEIGNDGCNYFVKKSIDNLMSQNSNIDSLILGCTHYPLLTRSIEKFVPEGVRIFQQGEIVAEKLRDYLLRHPDMAVKCTKNATETFLTTETPELFNSKASVFLEKTVSASQVDISKADEHVFE